VDYVIVWSGFLGAWLLVAGPIYQAALELEDENLERDALAAASKKVDPPPRISPWWWLLPPVAYLRQRRRARGYRDAVMHVLTPEQMEQLIRFTNKATGWAMVAAGAFFIAIKETWELVEKYEWPTPIWWILIVVMVVISTSYTVGRMRRSHQMKSPAG
jgi:hypothetical protein